jgi:hypothetical protein
VVPIALTLALLAGACGSTEGTRAEVARVVGEELGLADGPASCMAEGFVEQIGLGELDERGFGPSGGDDRGSDPAEGDETTGAGSADVADAANGRPDGTGDGDDEGDGEGDGTAGPGRVSEILALAPTVGGGCVDLIGRLADLVEGAGGRLARSCVDGRRLDVWPLVGVLVQPRPEPTTFTGQARSQLLDAVRGCVDDSTLARLAGLDDPDELLAVLVADPFARSDLPADQDPCVTGAALDTLGIERLAEVGVDVGQPSLFDVRAQLSDAETDDLIEAFLACGRDEQLLRAISVTDEQIAPCILDGIAPGSEPPLVAGLFAGTGLLDNTELSRLADRCAEAAVAALFPPPEEVSEDVVIVTTVLARPYLYLWASAGRFEQACLPAGLRAVTDDAEAALYDRVTAAEDRGTVLGAADRAARRAYLAEVSEVLTACLRPWPRLLPSLWRAEITPESLPCIRSEIDDGVLDRMMDSYGPAVWEGAADAEQTLAEGLDATEAAIARCAPGADLERWREVAVGVFA